MSIEAGLTTWLKAQGSLSAIGLRIGPNPLSQLPTLPAITYQRISTDHITSHSGSSALDAVRMQIDVWAADYDSAHDLGAAVVQALDMQRGTWGATEVQLCGVLSEMDRYEPVTGYYRYIVDARLWFRST